MKSRRFWFWMLLSAVMLQGKASYADPLPLKIDAYSQGLSLFENKDYSAALPFFQQAVQDNPGNAKTHYYLGKCQQMTGDLRSGVLNYYISARLSPYPQLKAYADQTKDKLSLVDQEWVENQLAAFSKPPANTTSAPPAAQANISLAPQGPISPTTPAIAVGFGVRLSTGMAFFNLSDFQADINFRNSEVQSFQAANPSYGYKLQTSIDSLDAVVELNPYFTIGPDAELEFGFGYWPTNSVSYTITDKTPQYSVHSEYDLSSFEFLLKGRLYFPKGAKGIRFYFEPSAGLQPIDIHRTYNYLSTSATPSSDQTGEDVGSMAFDAGLNLGAVINLGPNVLFSLSGGYQLVTASGFQGTWSDAAVPSKNGAHGSLEMFKNQSGPSNLIFIPSDPSLLPAFGENSSTQSYCQPLSVDESGFRFTTDISCTF
ncbi:MAG TPA: tetratricopeptide repeat protein [bacterium]